MSLKTKILRQVLGSSLNWRLPDLMAPRYPVVLEYPIKPEPRYGYDRPVHEGLRRRLALGDGSYLSLLRSFADFEPRLAAVAEHPVDDTKPYWQNKYFAGLDAITLHGLIGSRLPGRFIEVGSGNSTKFARQAITDFGLSTSITSIDPVPRAEIDDICDLVIRQPMEGMDPAFFDVLEAGDILFVDNSHHVFQNSDVTAFFLDVLPRLRPGVIVHIHDIFLPLDYPEQWVCRHYSEQYMLAAFLLGGGAGVRTLLPVAYVSQHPALMTQVNIIWSKPMFQRSFETNRGWTGGFVGASYWMEIVGGSVGNG